MSLLARISTFARSPQGRKLAARATQASRDPRFRKALAELPSRLGRGRQRPRGGS